MRLSQGQAEAQTVYAQDPVSVAEKFKRQGARRLHVVDLDGAFTGKQTCLQLIGQLAQLGMDVEVGGGIRNLESLRLLFDQEVRWAILGTAVARDPEFVRRAAQSFPGRIIVGLDLKNGELAIGGWQKTVPTDLPKLLAELAAWGVAQIIYTEVSRDGMLSGPCFQGLEEMGRICPLPLIASGGVSSVEDLRRLASMEQAGLPIVGAIVGKALYDGKLALPEAIAACEE